MSWVNQMAKAMAMMQEACEANGEWNRCGDCPFNVYCTALMDAKLIDPCVGLDFSIPLEEKGV